MKPFDFFQHASPELLDWVHGVGDEIRIQNRSLLIREGEACDSIYILTSGSMDVDTSSQKGQSERLSRLQKGSLVGEMTWLENRPPVASVEASAGSTLTQIKHDTLNREFQISSKISSQFHRLVAEKLALQIQEQNAWIHRFSHLKNNIEPLRKVLMLFASMNEQDVHEFSNIGEKLKVPPRGTLVQQGEKLDSLYFILCGEANILVTIDGDQRTVGSSRRGELLGEMSLLLKDQQGASAQVDTPTGMELLRIDQTLLLQMLDANPAMASRFFRGMACMLSQRSRDQLFSHQLATTSQSAEQDIDELELAQLGGASRAGRYFDWLCRNFQSGARSPS